MREFAVSYLFAPYLFVPYQKCGGQYSDHGKGYELRYGRRSVWHELSWPHLTIPPCDYQRHWDMEGPHA